MRGRTTSLVAGLLVLACGAFALIATTLHPASRLLLIAIPIVLVLIGTVGLLANRTARK